LSALRIVTAPPDLSILALVTLVSMVTLLVLSFEKAVASNLNARQFGRLSQCLDVAVYPLAMGSLALGAAQLASLFFLPAARMASGTQSSSR
jgi:hypothetical protein